MCLDHGPVIWTFKLAGHPPRPCPAGEKGRYAAGGLGDATFTAIAVLDEPRPAVKKRRRTRPEVKRKSDSSPVESAP